MQRTLRTEFGVIGFADEIDSFHRDATERRKEPLIREHRLIQGSLSRRGKHS